MSKSFKYWQQGDCLIKPVSEIPGNAAKKPDRVLIEGETTGHAHRIAQGSDANLYVVNGMTYIECFKDTIVDHEEHDSYKIPPGTYYIDPVKEYDHFKEEARRVAD